MKRHHKTSPVMAVALLVAIIGLVLSLQDPIITGAFHKSNLRDVCSKFGFCPPGLEPRDAGYVSPDASLLGNKLCFDSDGGPSDYYEFQSDEGQVLPFLAIPDTVLARSRTGFYSSISTGGWNALFSTPEPEVYTSTCRNAEGTPVMLGQFIEEAYCRYDIPKSALFDCSRAGYDGCYQPEGEPGRCVRYPPQTAPAPADGCGDYRLQTFRGEECEQDKDCGDGHSCLSCKCYDEVPSDVTHRCGDGAVDAVNDFGQREECENSAGCPQGEICSGCSCVASDGLWNIQAGWKPVANVCGNGAVEVGEACEKDADCGDPALNQCVQCGCFPRNIFNLNFGRCGDEIVQALQRGEVCDPPGSSCTVNGVRGVCDATCGGCQPIDSFFDVFQNVEQPPANTPTDSFFDVFNQLPPASDPNVESTSTISTSTTTIASTTTSGTTTGTQTLSTVCGAGPCQGVRPGISAQGIQQCQAYLQSQGQVIQAPAGTYISCDTNCQCSPQRP